MEETALSEVTILMFHRGEGFFWESSHSTMTIGLCNQPFCRHCDMAERTALKRSFKGGRLKVQLGSPFRRPDFWDTKEQLSCLAHLVEVLPVEEIARVVDEGEEGTEIDLSVLNLVVCSAQNALVVIDPGLMGFNGDKSLISKIIPFAETVPVNFITHGHLDHMRSAGYTRGPVYMSRLARRFAARHAYLEKDILLERAIGRARPIMPGHPVILEKAHTAPVAIWTFPIPNTMPHTM